ncbi:Asp-tRNA(Asn)/Glu-tRNA(Gln) amidotransferase subunit GatA [Candidatus Peribacteria bacterium]|nr:Asp-tRNA(Asn)/Glu-tRNA(Gln) amidotransferase subunit GatA [Candidatus Peribacteria bacterium]
MSSIPSTNLSALSARFQSGELTSRAITEAFLQQIAAQNTEINAYLTTTPEAALAAADAADARHRAGQTLGPLDGMPISLKDVLCTVEARTTAASKVLEHYQSPYDATVWARLKAAGMVLLGKVNTDEFTMGASTEHSAYGVTKNPHDQSRVAGGSSGGSAASVAAGMAPCSIGTDTGGSIRVPANFCGVTGLKPSYGRVSRWGTIPMASSLDTTGPLAPTPADCALLLQAIAGKDPRDATTTTAPVPDYTAALQQDIRGMRVGIPREFLEIEGTDAAVLAELERAKETLQELGATVTTVSLPHSPYAIATYYIIAPSEISANMARYDGIRFGQGAHRDTLQEIYYETREQGLGDEVKRRILIGTYSLSSGYYDAYYRKAQQVRTLIRDEMQAAFQQVDLLLSPVSPTPAFPIGQNTSDPLKMYLEDIFVAPVNLAGNCGISVPTGHTAEGLPVGVQLMGPSFGEDTLLRAAHHLYTARTA